MVNLTELQGKVLEYIATTNLAEGVPPTLRELAAFFGWKAVGSAQDMIGLLRKKGYLQASAPGKSRQLLLTAQGEQFLVAQGFRVASSDVSGFNQKPKNIISLEKPKQYSQAENLFSKVFQVPLLGMVQAGNARERIEEIATNYYPFPSHLQRKGGNYFCVEVDGYSMMNAGLLPGDVLLVESEPLAKNNEIVLAGINENEVTVKRFAVRGSKLFSANLEKAGLEHAPPALLIPENPQFSPIPYGIKQSDRIIGVVKSLFRENMLTH